MPSVSQWLEGARLRTLPVSVAPVILGSAAAAAEGAFSLPRALLAAAVALCFQIGVNFANDYSDGVRGTDEVRSGPVRLTASGLVAPSKVKAIAFAFLGLGCLAGLGLLALSGDWWLIAAGAAAVAGAWFYTGGKNPYGYRGLGEIGVFIFFGIFATLGTTWTQAHSLPWVIWVSMVGIGLLACAALMINNIRDIPTDVEVGKHTLAVRLGERRARLVFAAMIGLPVILGALCGLAYPWAWAAAGLAPLAALIIIPVLRGARGPELIVTLRNTGLFEVAYSLVVGIGLLL